MEFGACARAPAADTSPAWDEGLGGGEEGRRGYDRPCCGTEPTGRRVGTTLATP